MPLGHRSDSVSARRHSSGAVALGVCVLVSLSIGSSPAFAQSVSQKGFLDLRGFAYPQTTANDDTRLVGEALLRYEASAKPAPWLRVAGALDARADTHDQTAWDGVDWSDRGARRPGFGVRRFDVTLSRGPLTLQVGKQIVRWGKTDILIPTDRFAPRDFLSVFDDELLGVTAARLTAALASDTIDAVVARFTPSRIPLLDQRWAGLTAEMAAVALIDDGSVYPNGVEAGARWSHVGRAFEFSLSGFRGHNNLPLIEAARVSASQGAVTDPSAAAATAAGSRPCAPMAGVVCPPLPPVPIVRVYPAMWMAGADAAIPLSHVTIKGEAAFFGSSDLRADEYWLYVIQVERQKGEWLFVGGYAGEVVTTQRVQASFAPDRGLTRSFLGRASYTIDTNRSVAFEGAVRQNGDGSWLRAEYSQASGQHLRVTARATWIRGDPTDFFGRYRRNSHVMLTVRYSY
jgi:hypothetical protein